MSSQGIPGRLVYVRTARSGRPELVFALLSHKGFALFLALDKLGLERVSAIKIIDKRGQVIKPNVRVGDNTWYACRCTAVST